MKRPSEDNFRLVGLSHRGIVIGQAIKPTADAGLGDKNTPREPWALKTGLYTPRQLVEAFAPILDAIVFRLGRDAPGARPVRARLLDNLAANLDTSSPEATLNFSVDDSPDAAGVNFTDSPLDVSRQEMANQAQRIGETLVEYARNHVSPKVKVNPDLFLRSPCEGHQLIPSNVELMFGRRSQSHLMQLFNEYLHQMILLRDALLPFQNYEDVLIPVNGHVARGIRYLEPSRSEFLAGLVAEEVTQSAVVKHAQALLAPNLALKNRGSDPGYGFQYAHGVVLPAVLAGGNTPLHLLRYLPTRLVQEIVKDVVFDYGIRDYALAPRAQIPAANGWGSPGLSVVDARITAVPLRPGAPLTVRQLELELDLDDGSTLAVDVGQITRGHRYAHVASSATPDADSDSHSNASIKRSKEAPAVFHDAASILTDTEEGLITAKRGGLHVIPVQEPLVSLAVLGRIYPKNVVLLPESESLSQVETATAGKGVEPQFVIWGGVARGGFRGVF